MVTRETSYIGQLYFGLSTDDPADVAEWHNGDRILLMDQDKMMVYDEAAFDFHEIPMGGGGGGGGSESHPYIQTFDYVQATAWTTDANGNTKNFIDNYCNHGNGIYWIGVHQTSSDTYKAVRGFVIRQSGGSVPGTNGVEMLRGTSAWSTAYNTSSSFHIVAGAAIRIWYIPLSTTLEDMTT